MNILQTVRNWLGVETRAVGIPPEWHEWVLGRGYDGNPADPVSALQASGLVSCIRVLSTAAAMIDFGVYKRIPGGEEIAPDHSVHRLISIQPNANQTSFEWRIDMVTRMLIYGFSFDQILMNTHTEVIGLNPIHPSRVTIDDRTGKRIFVIRKQEGGESTLPADQALYIPYLFEGKSLYEHAAKAIGLSMSADNFAQRFFKSGGIQQLKLESDQVVPPDKKREIVEAFHTNMKAGKTPFMDSGTKLSSLNVKFEEVQLKDTRTFQLRDIARIMGVQPHLIGDLERSTNNNIEHQGIEFANYTVRPLATAITQRVNISLFGARENAMFFAKFDLPSLQPADFESTADAVKGLVAASVMTPNEGRRRVGLNPHPDGNELLIQGAMVPTASLGKQQQQQGANNGTP